MRLLRHDKHSESPKCNLFASHHWMTMLRWSIVIRYYIVVVGAIAKIHLLLFRLSMGRPEFTVKW
jgi:hypothetical protein